MGMTDGQVCRRTGIPRRTINGWRRLPQRRRLPEPDQSGWRPGDAAAYAYALGIYLGDGHIARVRSCCFLRVSMDGAYPGLVAEVRAALGTLFAPRTASALDYAPGRGVVVQLSHPALPFAFPQHGPGKKHHRRIELQSWQRELTHRHPQQLLRGLIHSDGCRVVNRFSTLLPSGREGHYAYPRYFFTNFSAGIRGIFCEHCELLGIRWTQSNPRNISVSHRTSVARLDEFIGPKS